jgi:hypothetical protein
MKPLPLLLALCFMAINAQAQNKYTQTSEYKLFEKTYGELGLHCELSKKETKKRQNILKENLQKITTDFCIENHIVTPSSEDKEWFIATYLMDIKINYADIDTIISGRLYLVGIGLDTVIITKNYTNQAESYIIEISKGIIINSNQQSDHDESPNKIIGYYRDGAFYLAHSDKYYNALNCYKYLIVNSGVKSDTYTLIKEKQL